MNYKDLHPKPKHWFDKVANDVNNFINSCMHTPFEDIDKPETLKDDL